MKQGELSAEFAAKEIVKRRRFGTGLSREALLVYPGPLMMVNKGVWLRFGSGGSSAAPCHLQVVASVYFKVLRVTYFISHVNTCSLLLVF